VEGRSSNVGAPPSRSRRSRAAAGRRFTRRGALATAAALLVVFAMPAEAAPSLSNTRIIGGPGKAFVYAWGAATLPDGDILISDYWNYHVKRFNPDGSLQTQYATGNRGTNFGQHLAPYDLAVDPSTQTFYFGDVDSQRTVDEYSYATGAFVLDFGGANRYAYPSYPAVTSDGRVIVADSRNHRISVNTTTGQALFTFGSQGSNVGQFRTPRGIDICPNCAPNGDDWLYIADSGNGKVQQWLVRDGGTTASSVQWIRNFGRKGSQTPAEPGTFGAAGNLRGLAVDDRNGWVYVVDATNGFTSKFDLQGTYLLRFGGGGTGPGRFPSGGRGITVGADGRVWISDLAQFRVHIFSPTGQFLAQVPNPPQPPPLGGFNTVSDVAVDEQGNIWAIDTMNQRFQKFAPNGTALAEWGMRGGGTEASFNYPRGIAVDDTGPGCPTYTCVIVADTDAGAIVKFDANGSFLWSLGGGGTIRTWSMAVAPDGRIFAPDIGRNRVVIISPNGQQIGQFGTPGTGNGQFRFPRGIAYDPTDGTIWVADSTRGDIQHFTTSGQYLGRVSPAAAGRAQQQLMDVAVAGNYLYVSDAKGHRVSIFSKSGQFVAQTTQGQALGPMGLHIEGNALYVAESVGNRIRQYTIVGS
jgi:tripartite motif-containing protein 71